MALELYWGSGSPFSWRVMLTLEVKGLTYESKLLEFSKGQHKSAEYLKLNPRGKVPTLKDGEWVLYESVAIMAYLDRKYPDPPIFGRTPQETGLIWRAISETESYLLPAGNKVIVPIFFGKGLDKTEEIQTAAAAVRDELKRIDTALASSVWVVGSYMSAADIALFPLIQILSRAASKDAAQPLNLGFSPLGQNYSKVAAWVKQIENLPGYDRTYPPHWREYARWPCFKRRTSSFEPLRITGGLDNEALYSSPVHLIPGKSGPQPLHSTIERVSAIQGGGLPNSESRNRALLPGTEA